MADIEAKMVHNSALKFSCTSNLLLRVHKKNLTELLMAYVELVEN